MASVLNFLVGKKTYIMAALAGILGVAHSLGYINDSQFATATTLTGAAGLAALRAGVSNAVAAVVKPAAPPATPPTA